MLVEHNHLFKYFSKGASIIFALVDFFMKLFLCVGSSISLGWLFAYWFLFYFQKFLRLCTNWFIFYCIFRRLFVCWFILFYLTTFLESVCSIIASKMLKHFTELFFNFFQQKPHVGKSGSPFDAEVFMLVINDNLYLLKYAKVYYPFPLRHFFLWKS